jgi:hypothetical protein
METNPAVKRDRRAYWREYQRKRYAASKAQTLSERAKNGADGEGRFYSLQEKMSFFRFKLTQVAAGAKPRGKEFSIKLQDVQLPDKCPVLGITLDYGWPITNLGAVPSLDRIDNDKGYVPGNIIVMSLRANKMKGAASKDEMIRAADFWLGFYEGDPEVLSRLGEPPKGVPSFVEKSKRHEARKAYWREYQRARAAQKKASKQSQKVD